MVVSIYGHRYKVWDWDDPDQRRFMVTKDRKCTCGHPNCEKKFCEHVLAVQEYLKKGGQRAHDEPKDPRGSLECQLLRIKALREKCIKEDLISPASLAIISCYGNHFTKEEYDAWVGLYALPSQWPIQEKKKDV